MKPNYPFLFVALSFVWGCAPDEIAPANLPTDTPAIPQVVNGIVHFANDQAFEEALIKTTQSPTHSVVPGFRSYGQRIDGMYDQLNAAESQEEHDALLASFAPWLHLEGDRVIPEAELGPERYWVNEDRVLVVGDRAIKWFTEGKISAPREELKALNAIQEVTVKTRFPEGFIYTPWQTTGHEEVFHNCGNELQKSAFNGYGNRRLVLHFFIWKQGIQRGSSSYQKYVTRIHLYGEKLSWGSWKSYNTTLHFHGGKAQIASPFITPNLVLLYEYVERKFNEVIAYDSKNLYSFYDVSSEMDVYWPIAEPGFHILKATAHSKGVPYSRRVAINCGY